ncbi:MAG: hypothetical protein ACR2MO_14690 [Acidimicrobiales bacterium]
MTRRRPLYLLGFGALAVPLLAASFAYACGALASLSINPGSADVGATVNGTGANFASVGMGAPTVEPVVIRLNSRTGPTLWSGRPDATGAIAFAFQVPKVDPGTYVVLAMQNNADGQPASGTPVRATLEVTGPAPVVAAPVVAPAPEPAAAPAAAAAPAPAQTPARATAPRVRVAAPVTRAAAAAPAPAAAIAPAVVPDPVTPAPAVEAPVAAPAPAVTPAPESAPATAPARRSVMVSMSGGDDGSPVLAIALVGIGLVLALGASALVLAGRREGKAPARARR